MFATSNVRSNKSTPLERIISSRPFQNFVFTKQDFNKFYVHLPPLLIFLVLPSAWSRKQHLKAPISAVKFHIRLYGLFLFLCQGNARTTQLFLIIANLMGTTLTFFDYNVWNMYFLLFLKYQPIHQLRHGLVTFRPRWLPHKRAWLLQWWKIDRLLNLSYWRKFVHQVFSCEIKGNALTFKRCNSLQCGVLVACWDVPSLRTKDKGKMVKPGYLAVQFSIIEEEGSKTEQELGYMRERQVSQKQTIMPIHCVSGRLAVGFITGSCCHSTVRGDFMHLD